MVTGTGSGAGGADKFTIMVVIMRCDEWVVEVVKGLALPQQFMQIGLVSTYDINSESRMHTSTLNSGIIYKTVHVYM